jgi:hypothetical protein
MEANHDIKRDEIEAVVKEMMDENKGKAMRQIKGTRNKSSGSY